MKNQKTLDGPVFFPPNITPSKPMYLQLHIFIHQCTLSLLQMMQHHAFIMFNLSQALLTIILLLLTQMDLLLYLGTVKTTQEQFFISNTCKKHKPQAQAGYILFNKIKKRHIMRPIKKLI
ncbi:hypothetical protein AVI51_14935 [Piscirickettsia salmonis]|nr:hypothetical protein AVI48_10210 [Piscirickettsia salmonis]APS48059.1 hypothetical protein AVI49_10815 [Piscirickettsia salmonis]APS52017.1 hypothetical protein AVI50_15090 [Piscirickettsia salmonis]APS55234.1 hypothetical protein AVI51_14935 [Piscirickettsia salmonis]APS58356.1 hypothetical protein AVI52_14660 [Piscirickettsia salmonis]